MAFLNIFHNHTALHSFRCKGCTLRSKVIVILVIVLCIDTIPLSSAMKQNVSPASSANTDGSGKSSCDGLNKSLTQGSSGIKTSSALSSPAVRDVTARPISDISITHGIEEIKLEICPNKEKWCLVLGEDERLALEAIYALHHQLDDDMNGNIDPFESDEYLREELKYDKDYEKRQENFHKNNDNLVSVKELWQTWVRSEAHNWTADQTVEWFEKFVGLSEIYRLKFIELEINGTYLPRLAVNHNNFLSKDLGIKDVITRQKLNLKAQDVVLFGPPRDNINSTLDAILVTLLVVAVTICYLVYRRYKLSQQDLRRMSKSMATMVKTEESLKDLQKELEQARRDQEVLETEAASHHCSPDEDDEILKLRDEVLLLRNELQHAQVELQETCWLPPPALTHWLQKTYELEAKTHDRKRLAASKQLQQAKDACEKLRKKRSSVIGAFVASHANAIDNVDKAIMEARNVLTEVTQEFQERMKCWQQIELLLKSPIINNNKSPSRSDSSNAFSEPRTNPMGNSQDLLDFDDDDGITINCGPPANKSSTLPRCQSLQSMAYPYAHQEHGHRLRSNTNVEHRQDGNMKNGNMTPKLVNAKDRRLAFRTAVTESRNGPQFPYNGRLANHQSHESNVFNFEVNDYYPQRLPFSPGGIMIPKTREEDAKFSQSFTFDEELYLNNNRIRYSNDGDIQQAFHH